MTSPLDLHAALYREFVARFRAHRSEIGATSVAVLPFALLGKPGLLKLRNTVLYSGEWQMQMDGRLYMDAYVVQPAPPRSAYLLGVNRTHAQVFSEPPIPLQGGPHVLLGGAANYAHWVLDTLPRLGFLKGIPNDARLLTGPQRPTFTLQSLQALGIGEERLLRLEYPAAYSIDEVIVPSTLSGSGTSPLQLQPHVVQWLRATFLPMVGAPRGKRRLFVSREGEASARLTNHEEVGAALSALGFETVRPQTMSFLEQVKLFAEAACVVGPHGAAFANMVFAPPRCGFLELLGPRWHGAYSREQFFTKLASLINLRSARLVGTPVHAELVDPLHLVTEEYRIDPAELSGALRPLL